MKLEDRLEILDIISKLAYTHDTMDIEGYRDLYTEDILRSNKFKDTEPEYREGREKSVGATVNRLKKGVVSFLIVHQQGEDAHPSLMNSGLVDLVFLRTDKGWKISEFHIKFDIPRPY